MSWTSAWEWQTLFAVDEELLPRSPSRSVSHLIHEHQRRWLLPGKRHLDLRLIDGEAARLRILSAEKGDLQLWRSRDYAFAEGPLLVDDLRDLKLLSADDEPFQSWSSLEEGLRRRHPRLITLSLEQSVSTWSQDGCELAHGRFVAGGQRSSLLAARSPDRRSLERMLAPRLRGLYPACDSVRALLELLQQTIRG